MAPSGGGKRAPYCQYRYVAPPSGQPASNGIHLHIINQVSQVNLFNIFFSKTEFHKNIKI
jgi:hypothetical protein